MITIPVTVAGDHWLNPDQVRTTLESSNTKETVVLDLCAEGPSLHRLGVVNTVLFHCEKQGRSPDSIYISRWSNPVENVPFQRTGRADVSHFYWASDRYWPAVSVQCRQDPFLWGLFMGRPTIARLLLLKDLSDTKDALLSRMTGGSMPDMAQGINLDLQEFGPRVDLGIWYANCGIASLDAACIRDQYDPNKNTNGSLLRYYDRFEIEIVAESYVYGETFLPTEKTVRPLAAGKPMVVMGPRYFLRRLREQGFRTWQDLWDETYDDLEGAARVTAIQQVINDVRARVHTILPYLTQHAEHNRRTLARLIHKHRPGP